jgi:hypothetical protein
MGGMGQTIAMKRVDIVYLTVKEILSAILMEEHAIMDVLTDMLVKLVMISAKIVWLISKTSW